MIPRIFFHDYSQIMNHPELKYKDNMIAENCNLNLSYPTHGFIYNNVVDITPWNILYKRLSGNIGCGSLKTQWRN